jgi:hypothetical protein
MEDNPGLDRAYAIGGLAVAVVIALMSVDVLLGGRLSALFGRVPAVSRLAAVPDVEEEASGA